MILYSLKCEKDHVFEDWFSSSAAFDRQAASGEIACPECHSHHIEKAPMAPSVTKSSSSASHCPVAESTGRMPPCAGSCACFPG